MNSHPRPEAPEDRIGLQKAVVGFIDRFHLADSVDDVFTSGACYWFAHILYTRFISDGIPAQIMYATKDNHFGTQVGNRIYDITGDVTKSFEWVPWSAFEDIAEKERILRDCIYF